MSQADIADLQAVGRDAQAARREFILKDDQHAVWDYIRTLKNSRVDFVLDNAGFEVCPASVPYIVSRHSPVCISSFSPTSFLQTS